MSTAPISTQRYNRGSTCPICGGSETDPRGSGSRCFGFLGSDGRYAHCTREDHAGGLSQKPGSQTYAHLLRGPCNCGVEHGPAEPRAYNPPARKSRTTGTIEAVYDYADEAGELLFQAVRFANPKDFKQRRPDGSGGWAWSVKGIRVVPYRLPELVAADPALTVFVVEGEKDVENLRDAGLVATCNAGGAGKWKGEHAAFLKGRAVAVIPDHDKAGRDHASLVTASLVGIASTVRVLDLAGHCRTLGIGELPEKGDASDFLEMGGTVDELRRLAESVAPEATTPRILITTKEHIVVDQAIMAMRGEPSVYQRGNVLVTVLVDSKKGGRDPIERIPGTPRICPLPAPRLRGLLTKHADWLKTRRDRDGEEMEVPTHPPEWVVPQVLARGEWDGIRSVEGVTETPVLRPDGSILDAEGWDEQTGLIFYPAGPYPRVPARPSLDLAKRATTKLLELVVDFPFADEHHRAAWLAALLTPFARFAIDGPCPLFLFDANAPGTGKSKLTDLIAIIATGRSMSRTAYPDGDEEMRKRITSIALAGDRLVLIDNIATAFGGQAIDSALTGTTWRDRQLGRNEMTPELPLNTIWYATGNNVAVKGDMLRRVVPCRLETQEETPEERTGFTIKGDLVRHAKTHRATYVMAALTVLKAHFQAGNPGSGAIPIGSYEDWDRIIRGCVTWTTGFDPCETRKKLAESDPEASARTALVEGWAELPGGMSPEGLSAGDALKILIDQPALYGALRDTVLSWSRAGMMPSPNSLGMRLKAIKDRVIGGMALRSRAEKGTHHWRVEVIDSGGTKGTKGTFPMELGKNCTKKDPDSPCNSPRTHGTSPTSPFSPTTVPPRDRQAGIPTVEVY